MLTIVGKMSGARSGPFDNDVLLSDAVDWRVPHVHDMETTFREFAELTGLLDQSIMDTCRPEVIDYALAGNHVRVVSDTGQVRVRRVPGLMLLPFSGRWDALTEPVDVYLFWVPEEHLSRGKLNLGKDVMVIRFRVPAGEHPEFGKNEMLAVRLELLAVRDEHAESTEQDETVSRAAWYTVIGNTAVAGLQVVVAIVALLLAYVLAAIWVVLYGCGSVVRRMVGKLRRAYRRWRNGS